jgi:exo-beta-1,3-glucanase (GH17 family)
VSPPAAPPPLVVADKVAGLNFSPYLDGQAPGPATQISENQLSARLQMLMPLTRSVRTYSTTNGIENVWRIAHSLGLNVTVGAFLSGDTAQNARQKANLIAAANASNTDATVILGSEVLERADLSEAALIAELQQTKQALPVSVKLGYSDTAYQLLEHPQVVDQVDVVFANIYPYFDGVPLEQAVRHLDFIFTRVQAAVRPKTVVLSETGWPSTGAQRGGAVPSTANAAAYFANFVAWAKARNIQYFYFEAFDEAWKSGEGTQGPHWGILDSSGNMKTGISPVFGGTTVADNWTRTIPGGAGIPDLQFTVVPALGAFDDLRGRLTGVDPAEYRVAVFIYVNELWYPKPSFASPTVYPNIDGEWTVDITTGATDENATRIAAYLLPVSCRVPQLSAGSASIPAQIEANAVARREVSR